MQSFQNYIERLGLVKAELKCDQEASTLDVANALIKRCQFTALMAATPKDSKESLGRGERTNLIIQGISHVFDGLDGTTLCMANNFQVKGSGRTLYRSIPGKDYTGEVVPFGEVCFGRKHSEDGAKLNMRWMRGVFVGRLDRTDQFLLLTTTGAMKTRCVRRLEGDNAWDLQFLYLCVGSPWNATARSTQQKTTIQQKDELESGRRAKKMFLRHNMFDKYGRTSGCPGCVGNG